MVVLYGYNEFHKFLLPRKVAAKSVSTFVRMLV